MSIRIISVNATRMGINKNLSKYVKIYLSKLWWLAFLGLGLNSCLNKSPTEMVTDLPLEKYKKIKINSLPCKENCEGFIQFQGLQSITDNKDGTYTLAWNKPLINDELTYLIFMRESDALNTKYNFNEPSFVVKNLFAWTSADLSYKFNTCFIVRIQSAKYIDVNQVELCTKHKKFTFDGIDGIFENKDGSISFKWQGKDNKNIKFHLYERSEKDTQFNFSKPYAIFPNTMKEYSVSKSEALNKCYIVRAKDLHGLYEDLNLNEFCTNKKIIIK